MDKPHEMSERLVKIANLYSTYSEEIALLKKGHAIRWLTLRKEAKTDKETDMLFAATPEGQRETELTFLLKGLEKEMSALKTHLRVLDVFGN